MDRKARWHKAMIAVGIIVYITSNHGTFGGVPDDKDESVYVYHEDPVARDEPQQEAKENTGIMLDGYDSYLLAKIAMAEAGDQDTVGKALVIRVVLNRMYGKNEFPDTVSGVIYQRKQFSPVLEGKFEKVVPDEDCWRALDMVANGWDESHGALYFKMKCKSKWHERNLKFLFKHQDHYFFAEK